MLDKIMNTGKPFFTIITPMQRETALKLDIKRLEVEVARLQASNKQLVDDTVNHMEASLYFASAAKRNSDRATGVLKLYDNLMVDYKDLNQEYEAVVESRDNLRVSLEIVLEDLKELLDEDANEFMGLDVDC